MRENVSYRPKRTCRQRQYPDRPLRLRTFGHAFHQQFRTARKKIVDVGADQRNGHRGRFSARDRNLPEHGVAAEIFGKVKPGTIRDQRALRGAVAGNLQQRNHDRRVLGRSQEEKEYNQSGGGTGSHDQPAGHTNFGLGLEGGGGRREKRTDSLFRVWR